MVFIGVYMIDLVDGVLQGFVGFIGSRRGNAGPVREWPTLDSREAGALRWKLSIRYGRLYPKVPATGQSSRSQTRAGER